MVRTGIQDEDKGEYLTSEQYIDKLYFEWKDSVDAAEEASRDHYRQHPGHPVNPNPLWERDGLNEMQRQQAWTSEHYQQFKREGREFSAVAKEVVHSYEAAEFLDDIKCDYLGASDHFGFREISPSHNHSPFDVRFDYSVGVLNAYTESGTVIHIRETLDPEAVTREQKMLILVMNVMARDIHRMYAEDATLTISSPDVPHHFDETIYLKPRLLSGVNGQAALDKDNVFAPIYQAEMAALEKRSQASLTRSARGIWQYTPEGFTAGTERLRAIRHLDTERRLLGMLAYNSGYKLGERGVVSDQRMSRQQSA